MSDELKNAVEPFRWYLSSSWFNGLPDEMVPQHSDHVARRPPTLGDYRRLIRAAYLLSDPPESEPDLVERVARAIGQVDGANFTIGNLRIEFDQWAAWEPQARAAIAAMRPAIDADKVAEIAERHEADKAIADRYGAALAGAHADRAELLEMIGGNNAE
jgi:hypothetical protein